MRLDRFLARQPGSSRQRARRWLAAGRVAVDGAVVLDGACLVSPFTDIRMDNAVLQARAARYFMLHKPAGYLSATQDPQHPTVLALLREEEREGLHIAGRLDRASTGLLLLTDDSRWSRALTDPLQGVGKVYRVETAEPIHPDTARRFAEGIHFPYEGITTRPVHLEQLGPRQARLTLHEGRYHQIKRMFGRFRNPVVGLHRERIGGITLDPALTPGEYRALTAAEVASTDLSCPSG